MAKKQEKKTEMTRAQKTDATKGIIKELLAVKPMKHNELIEETAKVYTERFKSEETENVNDVKGRVGSVLDIMKKESEVMYDGGMYALKARIPMPEPTETAQEKPAIKEEKEKVAPKKKAKAKKTEDVKLAENSPVLPAVKLPQPMQESKTEETPAPKKRGRKPKAKTEEPALAIVEEVKVEEVQPETKPEPILEPKAEEKTEEIKGESTPIEQPVAVEEPAKEEPVKKEEVKEERALTVKPKAEVAPKGVVMDMSFLIGDVKGKAPKAEGKPQKLEEPKKEIVEEKKPVAPETTKVETPKKVEEKKEVKTETKPAPKVEKAETKPTPKTPQKTESKPVKQDNRAKQKQPTADEKLREAYLKRMRSLGGDYFEYYSVYLLERYSMRNGRRLEGMKISGGDHDGGIDGEIELTDKFGFKETIYIQSKNWDPDKGKEEYWVVGETLLQQFIGACACKQAKDGKQHCRGIFVTTSRFTPDAKRILEDMSDKIVGYDGNDLYEAAKECEFGLIKKNGEWTLDEKLLSGAKAFFNMF